MRFPLIFFIFIFITAAAASDKSVRQAEKLAGNFSRLEDARQKIGSVLTDSTTPPTAYALFVAGRIEEGAFRHYYRQLALNQADPNVDRAKMADALLAARKYYLEALKLDTVYDKKGRVQTKYSPHIVEFLNGATPSLYNAGVAYMNKRLYYPQGYEAFKAYAEQPLYSWYRPNPTPLNDSIQAASWFYAGVMAYNSQHYRIAANAFSHSRSLGYPKKEVLLNEISCLSLIARSDSSLTDSLTRSITRLSAIGHERFGLSEPSFIKKYVAGLLLEQQSDSAMNVVDRALRTDSVSPLLLSMRAALLRDKGRLREAADAYLVAAAFQDAEPITRRDAAKTIARYGIALISEVKGVGRTARERRSAIREKYLTPALKFAEEALKELPDDSDIPNTINTIQYYLH